MKTLSRVLSGRSARRVGLLLLTAVLGCQRASDDPTGGETHFLRSCDESSESSCGGEFDCLCGFCSLPCDREIACGALPGAVCVQSESGGACSESRLLGHCDVSCREDADCSALSAEHRCTDNVCRGPADPDPISAPPEDAASDATTSVEDAQASVCSASEVTGDEVLIMGDSFLALSHQVTAFLEGLARDAGKLSPGERYRDKSSTLDNTLALVGNGIANQYTSALEESPVKVVIMNGGGADVLLGSCEVNDAQCSVVVEAAAAAEALLAQMADDEIQHVIYVFYADPPDVDLREEIGVLRMMINGLCESSAVPCHWLDLRGPFEGHDEYRDDSSLFPSEAGAQVTAEEIWALMQDQCIAQ